MSMITKTQIANKNRYEFINVLKVLAAILITNSHYTEIWPYSFMAFGGLLGDVLYFAISGFCLADIKESFPKWYLKRILRIYPILWIVNAIGVGVGYFKISSIKIFIELFIYPTYFHFIASIMVLYIFYYFIVKYVLEKTSFNTVMICLTGVYIAIYLLLYDKTYYHIDVVEEGMVRFLFLAAMLLGVYFRNYPINKKIGILQYAQVIGLFLLYLISKITFSRISEISVFQILNVVILYVLLQKIFRVAKANEDMIVNMRKCFKTLINFIGAMTLEIYLTQYIVYYIYGDRMVFPVNFIVVSVSIIILSYLVHYLDKLLFDKIRQRLRKRQGYE